MTEPFSKQSGQCVLVYDGQCRLCVTAKNGLEQLRGQSHADEVRLIPYQSEEAKQVLGAHYRPGRPPAAFLVHPDRTIATGLDAFLPLLPGLKGGASTGQVPFSPTCQAVCLPCLPARRTLSIPSLRRSAFEEAGLDTHFWGIVSPQRGMSPCEGSCHSRSR